MFISHSNSYFTSNTSFISSNKLIIGITLLRNFSNYLISYLFCSTHQSPYSPNTQKGLFQLIYFDFQTHPSPQLRASLLWSKSHTQFFNLFNSFIRKFQKKWYSHRPIFQKFFLIMFHIDYWALFLCIYSFDCVQDLIRRVFIWKKWKKSVQ